jgi:hypothetical protein
MDFVAWTMLCQKSFGSERRGVYWWGGSEYNNTVGERVD